MGQDPHFRANVGIAVINDRGEVLAVERWPAGSERWQMAQGGIDRGEEPKAAAYRELEEELGLTRDQVELVANHPEWLAYELPRVARVRPGGLGQVQKWFLFRLAAPETAIDLGHEVAADAPRPELARWRWMSLRALAEESWEPRRPIYRRLASDWAEHLDRHLDRPHR